MTEAAHFEGLVVGSHGRHLWVQTATGQKLRCHTRGKKTEAVVGDRVRWQATGDEGVIEAVLPRRNLLARQDEWRTKSFAANLDQVLILVACEPPFSESQLCRALIACAAEGVPALIGLNKVDQASLAPTRERLAPYVAMGITVLELALKVHAQAAVATLQPALKGRSTLVLGPSGMGKSTLINLLVPGAQAQVGEISSALNSGKHTTTTTTWYWLDEAQGSALIDSPGFQEFGLRQVPAARLASLMPDLAPRLGQCRFYNCTHRHEPGCALSQAATEGAISPSRWRIYGELFDELNRSAW